MANNQLSNIGLFVPTTYIFDVTQLQSVDVNKPEFKELLVRLYQNINSICTALNLKDSGYYVQTEFMNSQLLFPNPSSQPNEYRQIFRTVVNFGALPNATSKSVAHNIDITSAYTFTRIYAAASNTTSLTYIPLPYVSTTTSNNIELDVNATNVTITTAANYSAYNVCYVICEYVKQ
jgi:hypothetical protein